MIERSLFLTARAGFQWCVYGDYLHGNGFIEIQPHSQCWPYKITEIFMKLFGADLMFPHLQVLVVVVVMVATPACVVTMQ